MVTSKEEMASAVELHNRKVVLKPVYSRFGSKTKIAGPYSIECVHDLTVSTEKSEGRFNPIITDFSRTSQPIVRYKLNDILVERQIPCNCGSPFTVLEQIEGRSDDVFYIESLQHPRKYQLIFPDFIRRVMISVSEILY